MSTIKADTLSDLAGTYTVPVATVAQGSAKCWVNFNGTGTVAIRASFNVSSITDNGTGAYTLNFTNALQDVNYNAVFGGGGGTANADTFVQERYATPTRTVSALAIYTSTLGGALSDREIVSVSIFR